MEVRRLYDIARDFETIKNLLLNDESREYTEDVNTTLERSLMKKLTT